MLRAVKNRQRGCPGWDKSNSSPPEEWGNSSSISCASCFLRFQAKPLSESAADATDLTEVDLTDQVDRADLADLADLADTTDRSPGVLTVDF